MTHMSHVMAGARPRPSVPAFNPSLNRLVRTEQDTREPQGEIQSLIP